MHNRLLFSITCFFIISCGFAQHLIVKKNGDRIYCRIVAEDSLTIFYTKPAQKSTFQIKKEEVEQYTSARRKESATAETPVIINEPEEILIIGISGGQASPRGDFESQDLYSTKSGLAKRGYVAKVSLILKVSKNFGFSAAYRMQSNGFNHKLLGNQLTSIYPGVIFNSESSNWRLRGFFGGVYFNFPVKKIKGFAFDFDFSAGFPKCDYPDLTITANQSGRYSTYSQHANSVNSVAILFGAGFKYSFHKNIAFNFNVNYINTKASFTDVYTSQFNSQFFYSDYTQKISSINVQAGLSFLLFPKNK